MTTLGLSRVMNLFWNFSDFPTPIPRSSSMTSSWRPFFFHEISPTSPIFFPLCLLSFPSPFLFREIPQIFFPCAFSWFFDDVPKFQRGFLFHEAILIFIKFLIVHSRRYSPVSLSSRLLIIPSRFILSRGTVLLFFPVHQSPSCGNFALAPSPNRQDAILIST